MNSEVSGGVRVQLDLALANIALLWDSAAKEAATVHNMKIDEIAETVGPREDPDVSACVALLFNAVVRRSGVFDAIAITVTTPDELRAACENMSQVSREPRGRIALTI